MHDEGPTARAQCVLCCPTLESSRPTQWARLQRLIRHVAGKHGSDTPVCLELEHVAAGIPKHNFCVLCLCAFAEDSRPKLQRIARGLQAIAEFLPSRPRQDCPEVLYSLRLNRNDLFRTLVEGDLMSEDDQVNPVGCASAANGSQTGAIERLGLGQVVYRQGKVEDSSDHRLLHRHA